MISRARRSHIQLWQCNIARLLSVMLLVVVTATVGAESAIAQDNFATLFLMQPVGGRTVGHGEAAVADTSLGTEALWWNPAGMARLRKRELAVHHGQSFGVKTDLISLAYPSRALGTIAASVFLANYGDDSATDSVGNPAGLLTSRYWVASVGYASPIGKRFSAGIAGKAILVRIICSGCEVAFRNQIASTYAVDLGAQYTVSTTLPLTIGASVRNLGQALQVLDEAQADKLPRIIQVGAQSRIPIAALKESQTALDVRADVMSSPQALRAPSLRVGADLTYKDLYTIRGGYKYLSKDDGLEGGLTAGVGLKYNSIQLDIARRFDSSNTLGESAAPTYVSLRWTF